MPTIKVPATSANVGPGFDSLGIALNLYATFDVELSEKDILENVEAEYNNENNLFLTSYHRGMQAIGIDDHVHMILNSDVPISRGLGSSATMICGGLLAASILHNNALSMDEIFKIASEIEGHPDNVAPALFGGFTACMQENNTYYMRQLPITDKFHWYVCIPDFEVSTEKARAILPDQYPRAVSASNSAHAILLCEALRTGDMALLKLANHDNIHEPYRSTLIHDFDTVKQILTNNTNGTFMISGSGSTCLCITDSPITNQTITLLKEQCQNTWQIKEVQIAHKGSEIYE